MQFLVALAALGFLGFAVAAFFAFSKTTPEVLAEAETRRAADMQMQDQFHQDCLADPTIPEEERELVCGDPLGPENFPVTSYIDPQPFRLATDLPTGGLVVAAATAMLAFVVGATYVGAEWSTRSMVALLFWEPRRLRVVGVKTIVAAGAGGSLAAVGSWAGSVWAGRWPPPAEPRPACPPTFGRAMRDRERGRCCSACWPACSASAWPT